MKLCQWAWVVELADCRNPIARVLVDVLQSDGIPSTTSSTRMSTWTSAVKDIIPSPAKFRPLPDPDGDSRRSLRASFVDVTKVLTLLWSSNYDSSVSKMGVELEARWLQADGKTNVIESV